MQILRNVVRNIPWIEQSEFLTHCIISGIDANEACQLLRGVIKLHVVPEPITSVCVIDITKHIVLPQYNDPVILVCP